LLYQLGRVAGQRGELQAVLGYERREQGRGGHAHFVTRSLEPDAQRHVGLDVAATAVGQQCDVYDGLAYRFKAVKQQSFR
jgi:hypothetical protein